MTNDDVERLRQCEKKIVTFNCSNGELLKAKIVHVENDHRDVIFDLISTSKPETYKAKDSFYVLKWDDILGFHEDPD